MALYIKQYGHNSIELHSQSFCASNYDQIKEIFSYLKQPIIQADGDELQLIKARFPNLPATHGGTCIWRGDMALFICDNITSLIS